MASIMENLIEVLDQEVIQYKALLELSERKTQIVVAGDVPALIKLTDEEQVLVDRLSVLDRKRTVAMKDVADVMNKNAASFRLTDLVALLAGRPSEQKKLSAIIDSLRETATQIARVNDQNRELIKNTLEMIEFDLNLVRGMKAAPETAQYTSGGYNAGSRLGVPSGKFDAKQ